MKILISSKNYLTQRQFADLAWSGETGSTNCSSTKTTQFTFLTVSLIYTKKVSAEQKGTILFVWIQVKHWMAAKQSSVTEYTLKKEQTNEKLFRNSRHKSYHQNDEPSRILCKKNILTTCECAPDGCNPTNSLQRQHVSEPKTRVRKSKIRLSFQVLTAKKHFVWKVQKRHPWYTPKELSNSDTWVSEHWKSEFYRQTFIEQVRKKTQVKFSNFNHQSR